MKRIFSALVENNGLAKNIQPGFERVYKD